MGWGCIVGPRTGSRKTATGRGHRRLVCPAKDGATWYFGEMAKDFESFDGDNPRKPELVSNRRVLQGGAQRPTSRASSSSRPPRKAMSTSRSSRWTTPRDVTEILSTKYAFGKDAELDQSVPAGARAAPLRRRLRLTGISRCSSRGSSRGNTTRAGIGVFLEVEVVPGEPNNVIQLVTCNVDNRCKESAEAKRRVRSVLLSRGINVSSSRIRARSSAIAAGRRWLAESERRPEPLQLRGGRLPHDSDKVLVGTPDWVINAASGAIRGFR